MRQATPTRIVKAWFDWYCRFAIRKHFHALRLYGDAPFDPTVPTLYAGNHTSFWDVIAINHLIGTRRRQPAFCMADAEQVRLHPFFSKVGAFSVDLSSKLDGGRAILHAAKLLTQRPSAVVIYPQGKLEPASAPLVFRPGLERLMKRVPQANVVAVAARYEFWTDQRPEMLIDLSAVTDRTAEGVRRQLTDRLEFLTRAGRERQPGTVLLQGRPGIDRW